MSFKHHKRAPAFFQKLMPAGGPGRFDTQFDAYYYCLMCGLDRRRLGTEVDVGEEFVKDYVQTYQPYADLIAGLLVDAELVRISIPLDDVKSVEKKMVDLLEPISTSKLKPEGLALLNRYAAGGFEVISDAFATPPQSLEEFFTTYQGLWPQVEEQAVRDGSR
ncbi:hypothetical protein PRJ39_25155 [Lysobacter enzymogenes]|uniref:hypothetical protein n=1 Tax=Lysobacter enzymogenes TaxID=69 RepID=UPI003748D816